uniref:Uncharacterized protein n=1 Tax=Populus trichocarpa TaxID=3694 RepID=A0A2K2B5H2_POPTR
MHSRVLQAGMICIWNMSRSLRFLLLIGSPPVFCFYKINTTKRIGSLASPNKRSLDVFGPTISGLNGMGASNMLARVM